MTEDNPILVRGRLRQTIINCTDCGLRQTARKPVAWRGPAPAELLVIGEAPGAQEDLQGMPFIGPAGKHATNWLVDYLGLDPEKIAWTNIVCCFPHEESGRPRPPTWVEVLSCRQHLVAQVEIINPKHILVFGASALSALVPAVSLVAGRIFEPKLSSLRNLFWKLPFATESDPWCYATYHPSAGLRNGRMEKAALEDLEAWKEIIDGPGPVHSTFCVVCRYPATVFTESELPFCTEHLPTDLRRVYL